MQSTEESDQSPETQGNTRRIGNTCVSINLTFVKSRLGIFEAAIIVRILSWLWYFEIQDSVQHSKAGVDQKPSDLGRWILCFIFINNFIRPTEVDLDCVSIGGGPEK